MSTRVFEYQADRVGLSFPGRQEGRPHGGSITPSGLGVLDDDDWKLRPSHPIQHLPPALGALPRECSIELDEGAIQSPWGFRGEEGHGKQDQMRGQDHCTHCPSGMERWQVPWRPYGYEARCEIRECGRASTISSHSPSHPQGEVAEQEQHGRQQAGGGKGQDPGQADVAECPHLDARLVGPHGSGDARGKDVGRADRQAAEVGQADGRHGHELGAGALGVGQVGLADLLGHGDHDPLVADRGADAQAEGHAHDDPGRARTRWLAAAPGEAPPALCDTESASDGFWRLELAVRAGRSPSGPASDPRPEPRGATACRRAPR